MFKTIIVGAFASAAMLTPAFAAPGDAKMTKAQCESLWSTAQSGATGDLAMAKAAPYVSDFKKADKNSDSKLSATEWMDACDKGFVRTAAASSGGSPGTSSGATSDRTPGGATERTPGAGPSGAVGTDAGKTPSGTSDRTPAK